VGAVAKAVNWKGNVSRCENLSQLVVEISRLLEGWTTSGEEHEGKKRFVLVFDGIDRQRDAPPTLFPALARLGEIVSPPPHSCSIHTADENIDPPPHHNLHNHRPAPQFPPRPRRPTHLLPSLHQTRTPLHPRPHNTHSPPPKRRPRNAGYLVPLLQRSLGLNRQTLIPLPPLLPRPLLHTLAEIHSANIKQPIIRPALQ
jgi:hypothetical protein